MQDLVVRPSRFDVQRDYEIQAERTCKAWTKRSSFASMHSTLLKRNCIPTDDETFFEVPVRE